MNNDRPNGAGQLHGWEAIARYLKVSPRTAQAYERDRLLPVHRMPGKKGRVWAKEQELACWQEEQDQTGPPKRQWEQPPVATVPAEEQLPGLPVFSERGRKSVVLVAGAAVGLVVLVIIASFAYRFRHLGVPAHYQVMANTITIQDAQGQELWHHVFPRELSPPDNRCVFADVDGDGQIEVVVPYIPRMSLEDPSSQTHELLCFSQDGQRLKWWFTPGRPKVTDNTGEQYFPPYWLNNVRLVPGRKPADARIVVSSNHNQEAPDQVAVLDGRGMLVGEYWHPGHLPLMGFADLDHDGKPELLLAGVNNGQHAATLVVFDPDNVAGTATGLTDTRFGLQGFPSGTEKAVLVFPRTSLALSRENWQPYNRVVELKITNDRVFVRVTDSVSQDDPKTLTYELDYALNIQSISPSWEYQRAYNQLKHVTAEQAAWKQELETLRSHIVVHRQWPQEGQKRSEAVHSNVVAVSRSAQP